MKRTTLTSMAAGIVLACLAAGTALAGEVDILVDKLVKKGILSEQDASEILSEVKEEAKKERAAVVQETKEAIKSQGGIVLAEVPEWVKRTKLTGDLRLRYEFADRKSEPERHRGRYRLRVGLLTEVTDKVEVGFGFTTGSGDPRSRNQSMGNSFESPDLRLDYVYASYRPSSWLTLVAGKFKNPLWLTSDLLWDSDITPEGVSALVKYQAGSATELFMNSGVWVLDERKDEEEDPMMYVVQPGYRLNIGKRFYVQNALTLYQFQNVEGTVLDYTSKTNTLTPWTKVLRHDYDAYSISAEAGYKEPFGLVPWVALFGEYINNRTISTQDDGHVLGFRFGHQKVSKKGQWQAKWMYRRLERDAWPDIFPDGDAYGGETNTKGQEMIFEFGLLDNVSLALDYYYMRRILGESKSEDVFQADLNFKF